MISNVIQMFLELWLPLVEEIILLHKHHVATDTHLMRRWFLEQSVEPYTCKCKIDDVILKAN